ncbi:MAG: hypothetical protein HQM09_24805 [Candidatus Riflebacteria bacterium]|nr:hypothetical protein [Candidatus Riflebacteria bacterium]
MILSYFIQTSRSLLHVGKVRIGGTDLARGGRRVGAGRKPAEKKRQKISVTIKSSLYSWLRSAVKTGDASSLSAELDRQLSYAQRARRISSKRKPRPNQYTQIIIDEFMPLCNAFLKAQQKREYAVNPQDCLSDILSLYPSFLGALEFLYDCKRDYAYVAETIWGCLEMIKIALASSEDYGDELPMLHEQGSELRNFINDGLEGHSPVVVEWEPDRKTCIYIGGVPKGLSQTGTLFQAHRARLVNAIARAFDCSEFKSSDQARRHNKSAVTSDGTRYIGICKYCGILFYKENRVNQIYFPESCQKIHNRKIPPQFVKSSVKFFYGARLTKLHESYVEETLRSVNAEPHKS